ATREAWTPLPNENPFVSFLRHSPQHYGLVQGTVALAFADHLFETVPPAMIGAGVDVIARGNASMIARLGFRTIASRIGFLGAASTALWLLDACVGYFHSTTSERLALAVENDLRNEAYRHLERLDAAVIESRPVSDWIVLIDDDIARIGRFIGVDIDPIITIAANSLIVLTTFLSFSPVLALAHLALAPFLFFLSRAILSRLVERYKTMREYETRLTRVLHGNVAGITTIASYTQQEYEANRVAQAAEEWGEAMTRFNNLSAFYGPAIRVTGGIGFLSTLLWGSVLAARGDVSTGAYSQMSSASLRLLNALGRLGGAIEHYERANVSMARVVRMLERRPEVTGGAGFLSDTAARGDIVFEAVRFGYNSENPVLRDVDIRFPGGKISALVGSTGAGKTTVLKLLLRFYESQSGSIRIGGANIRDVELNSLRGQMALVPQNTFLFGGTIRENIAYSRRNASDAEVREAARIAGANAFISELPDGYETIITEGGFQLSGGQQQRIAIARAVLSKRSVLLFDEATSAIDFETEAAIQHSLREAAGDQTIVLIAHRLSTVRNADIIYVIDDGRVVEEGRHHDLIRANGLYASLWRIQTGETASRS
ncbi:MAG TPA: ABC transporter ATP-binding protein, partial [Rhizomicrobium sp.]|nr:ABC transporter ATP-binding protein [Rhizomicrobium sp.]